MFLTVLVILLPIVIFSQNNQKRAIPIQKFFYPKFNLDSLETNISEKERENLILKICLKAYHCDMCVSDSAHLQQELNEYLLEHESSIYFVDLDNDGDQDVIFNGKECSGFEIGIVEFYENKSDTLIRRFKIEGALINLDLENRTLAVYDYPCCAQQTNYVVEYRYSETFDLEFLTASLFIGHSKMMLPNVMDTNKKFKIKQQIALRWSPNTTDYDPIETCVNNKTNIIYTYQKNDDGTILHQNPDGWSFVKMNYNKFAQNPCIYNSIPGLPSELISFYGWMKFK